MPARGTLTIASTMIHEMPHGRWASGVGPQILFTGAPTPLNERTDRFIKEEMLLPSLATARQIMEVTPNISPVPQLVRDVLADSTLLAENSKLIAKHMHDNQANGSPAGVFMASIAHVGTQVRFIILKAEHQEGVRLRHTGSGSNIVFEVEHLTEIIMGQNSRVFKIGMFWQEHGSDKLLGLMVDKQNGSSFADYFLSAFLGCELVHRAEIQTETFVNGLGKLANDQRIPIERRIRYATASVAYVESPNETINPSRFIEEYIDREDRDLVATTILSEVNGEIFKKDLTLVKSQIGGLKMTISRSVTINATAEAMSDGTVVIEPQALGGPRTVIKGVPSDFEMSKPPR